MFLFNKLDCPNLCCNCSKEIEENCKVKNYLLNHILIFKADDLEENKIYRAIRYIKINLYKVVAGVGVTCLIAFLFLTDTPLFLQLLDIEFLANPYSGKLKIYWVSVLISIALVLLLFLLCYFVNTALSDSTKELIINSDTKFVRNLYSLYDELNYDPSSEFKSVMHKCSIIIKDYLSEVLDKKDLACAIRIIKQDHNGNYVYITSARLGLSPERTNTSQPLSMNEYLVQLFLKSSLDKNIIIICNDYMQLFKCKCLFTRHKNHEKYNKEEKSILIIPIYSELFTHRLYGMIFISSPHKNSFIKLCINPAHFVSRNMSLFIDSIANKIIS